MRLRPVRTWRDWVFETFGRGGYFSLRPLPMTDAERGLEAERPTTPRNVTRLNLDDDPPQD